VLEKAGYEVLDLEVDAAALVGSGVGVAESNPALLEAFDSVVGDGNAVDVAREVESRVLAVADLLDVDHPWFVFGPEVGIGFLFEASTFEGVCDLGAKNLGDGVSWEEKVRVGWLNPGIPVEGEGAGGDEEVVVGLNPPEEVNVYGFLHGFQFVASEAVPPLRIRYRTHYCESSPYSSLARDAKWSRQ